MMLNRHQPWPKLLAHFLLSIIILVHTANSQFRPISLPGFFSAIRYQNTACDGAIGESGTCLYENECLGRKGMVIGRCANGFSACCSFKFTCGGNTSQNETFFTNRQYPLFENDTNTCQVTILKQPNICQLRLNFEDFSLSQPDENGFCTTDSFMVRTTVGERLPILCGENAGQHIYVDMGQGSSNPVVLSIVTNGIKALRRWKIKINMISCNNLDMAPSGCLQYYRSATDIIQSFNYGPKMEYRARYLANLRYTACIRTEENFCAIKWETAEPGSFMFGAPFEGKDSEFGECTHQLPFFGFHSKTNDYQNGTTIVSIEEAQNKTLNSENTNERAVYNENLPGVVPPEKDPLYPHRLCSGGASGTLCNFDDFIGIDQGSLEGTGQGEDRFCGAKLLEHDFIISRSKPFQLKVKSNGDHFSNAFNSQSGFSLKYTQLPCVI